MAAQLALSQVISAEGITWASQPPSGYTRVRLIELEIAGCRTGVSTSSSNIPLHLAVLTFPCLKTNAQAPVPSLLQEASFSPFRRKVRLLPIMGCLKQDKC